MNRLIAVTASGENIVRHIKQIWDDGDAFCVIDTRLPRPMLEETLATLKPAAVIDETNQRAKLENSEPIEPGDALVIATSGTTGGPRGVVHTHNSVTSSAIATTKMLEVTPTDKWLACLPLSHIGGLAVVLRSVLTGTKLEVHPAFDIEAVTKAAKRGATLVSLVTRALNQVDPKLFRRVLIGSGAAPSKVPDNVVSTYGMSESGSGILYQFTEDGTTTQRTLDGAEIRLAEDQPRDEDRQANISQILVRGDTMFRCYRDDPHTQYGPGDWFATGDIGSMDSDGRFHVLGRSDDVINSGGEKVLPARLESKLCTHPAIAEIAVVGRPDPDWGEAVTAVIVLAEGHSAPDAKALRDFVADDLPLWYGPRNVEVRPELPRTTLGKLKRFALKQI